MAAVGRFRRGQQVEQQRGQTGAVEAVGDCTVAWAVTAAATAMGKDHGAGDGRGYAQVARQQRRASLDDDRPTSSRSCVEQCARPIIRDRVEAVIPRSHRHQFVGRLDANHAVHGVAEHANRLRRRHRHRDDDRSCSLPPRPLNRGDHVRAGGQAVVDQDAAATRDRHRRAIAMQAGIERIRIGPRLRNDSLSATGESADIRT
jgi:hypothetical protein